LAAAIAASGSTTAKRHVRRPDSGVRGDVLYGPTCPVQRPGQNCTRPYQATIRVLREPGGRLVASPRSDQAGHFSVRLAAGQYRLDPVSGHPFPRARPQQVTVRAHRFTHVVINFDSGIR
jgi:hypothetical protein